MRAFLFTERPIIGLEPTAPTGNGRRGPGAGAGDRSYDRDALHLFCVETLAPQTLSPDAVCLLGGDSPSA